MLLEIGFGWVVVATVIVPVALPNLVIDWVSTFHADVELEGVMSAGGAGMFSTSQLITVSILVIRKTTHNLQSFVTISYPQNSLVSARVNGWGNNPL